MNQSVTAVLAAEEDHPLIIVLRSEHQDFFLAEIEFVERIHER